jgi:hypothetical protein
MLRTRRFAVGRFARWVVGGLTLAALVVGSASTGTTDSRGARGYSFSTIDPPGSTGTFLFGVNSRGDVVGQSTDAAGAIRSFVLTWGRFRTISVPSAAVTVISPASLMPFGRVANAPGKSIVVTTPRLSTKPWPPL